MRPRTAVAAPEAGAPAGRGGRGGAAGASGDDDDNQPAADLLMRRLSTGEQRYLAKVAAYAFDDAGKQMAYTVRGQQRLGNGVYLMASGEQRTLEARPADYEQLAWSEKGAHLAVLRGDKAREKQYRDNVVLTWRGVGTPQVQAGTFDPGKASGFPAGMVVSEFTAPRWSSDGERLMIGLKEQQDQKPDYVTVSRSWNAPAADVAAGAGAQPRRNRSTWASRYSCRRSVSGPSSQATRSSRPVDPLRRSSGPTRTSVSRWPRSTPTASCSRSRRSTSIPTTGPPTSGSEAPGR